MKNKLIFVTFIIFLSWNLTANAAEGIDTAVDQELKSLWASMINKLQAGDVDGALGYFTDGSRWKYKEEFMLAKDKLPETSSNMGRIEPVYIKGDEAKYRVRIRDREGEYTHYIWFRKDISGRWKIDKF